MSAILRSAYDGANVEPLTKTSRIRASDPHVAFVGHITKFELETLLSSVDVANGLANRILWIAVRRAKEVPSPMPMPDAEINRLATLVASSIKFSHAVGEVPQTSEAAKEWDARYHELTGEHAGVLGLITSRAEAHVRRLALTYALLDQSKEVGAVHLKAALALWEYCVDSAKLIFGNSEASSLAARIISALTDGPKTSTELRKALSNHVSKKVWDATLAELQGQGRITATRSSTGGRPRITWSLTPSFKNSR